MFDIFRVTTLRLFNRYLQAVDGKLKNTNVANQITTSSSKYTNPHVADPDWAALFDRDRIFAFLYLLKKYHNIAEGQLRMYENNSN